MAAAPAIECDKKSADWILEYVIRHCDEDLIIRGLIKALPFSIENLKLKKMILLKKISLEVSKGSISEKTLKTLRSLMDLNRQICRDSDNEKAMQELCCKVAVECTAKHLRGTCEIDWNGYNGALRRLWSHSIEDTEDVEMDGGVSDIKKELLDVASNPSLRGRILEKYRQEDVLKRLNAFIEDSWKEMGPTFIETVAEDVAQGRYNPLGGRGSIPAVDSATMAAPSSETGSPPCNVPEKNEETTSTFPPCNVPENNEETASTYPPCNVPENNKETASTFPPCNVPENNEETASTFPPPWADVHPSSGPDMSKERKRMARNLKANQAISSEMKALGSSNGQPLSDRKFRDCQPNAINLEENEISGQDISIRTEATAAQEGGKESAPDLDDVNAHGRCRLGTYHISNNKRLLTPEYVKVNEELSRSTSELHLHVEDPLPNALKFAEGCMSRQEGFPTAVHLDGNKQLENPINEVEKGVLPESTTGVVNQVQNTEERGSGHQSGKSGRESVQFNIMDRNPTARTFQWDENDSIDSPEDNSPSASRKVRLPTPVRVHVSPLKRPRTAGDFAYRRKPTKWSVLEEETLKKEVARYGKGRWKYILEKNRETFEERTEVDLKDKWRNIERREGLHAP